MVYTIYEAAHILKIHERTVRNLIKRGQLKAFKAGRQWRISAESIKEMENKKQ